MEPIPKVWGICGETPFLDLDTASSRIRRYAAHVVAWSNRSPRVQDRKCPCPDNGTGNHAWYCDQSELRP